MLPRIAWLLGLGTRFGLEEETILFLIWLLLFIAALSLIAGLLCRPSAIACWFLHLCAANSRSVLSYGVDEFMTIGIFYLMVVKAPPF